MAYRIEITPRALKDLNALPTRERQRVADQIDSLEDNPRPQSCRKLKGRKRFPGVEAG